ncbi:MAG: SGNH/GDSL hydrolase family protein, partial [Chloroflexota bacterium]|nr:SGNH/GDSL hydrolase family protein [Chloroflexota bacterium]
DPSCSGASTGHMTQPQGVTPEPNPPQFDSLDADTMVVTLTIGGNDIGFSSITRDCVSQSPTGSPCQAKYVVGGRDEISERIAAAAPKVASVLQGIHARSPQAKVYLLNYIAIVPDSGPGCWPQVPIADGDVPWVRAKHVELNAMLAEQAAASGDTLVDVYAASIGHDACQLPGVRWNEPAVPLNAAAPFHPNLLGMVAMSRSVVAAVTSR